MLPEAGQWLMAGATNALRLGTGWVKTQGYTMSNAIVLQLEQTQSALRDALQRGDWEAIGGLDLQCREAVDQALADPHTPVEVLRERMQELLDLYRELVAGCNGEQQRIASELLHLRQSKKSAKVYQLFE